MATKFEKVERKLKNETYQYNFFEDYHLRDREEEKDLNEIWTNLVRNGETNLINDCGENTPTVRCTRSFKRLIRDRIKNKDFIILGIFGEPKTGKSEMSQSIAKYIQAQFKRFHNLDVDIKIGFNNSEISNLLSKTDRGDILIRDESPDETGVGSRTIKQAINNAVKELRKRQNCFIFVCPHFFTYHMIDYYLQTAGINKEERETRCLLRSTPFTAEKKQRLKIKGFVYFKLHKDKDLRKKYDKKKDKNIEATVGSGGTSNPNLNMDQFDKDKNKLIQICRKQNIDTKKGIRSKIILKGMNTAQYYILPLIEEVYSALHSSGDDDTPGKLQEKEGPSDNYTLKYYKDIIDKYIDKLREFRYQRDLDELIDIAKQEHPRVDFNKKIKAYNLIENKGYSQKNIAIKCKEFNSRSSVSKHYTKFCGILNDIKGKTLEKDLVRFLKSTKLFLHAGHIGGSGKPDVYAITEEENMHMYFSCKNHTINKKSTYIYREEIFPSLDAAYKRFAKDNEKVMVWLVFNDFGLNNCTFIPIDFLSTKKVYTMS